MNMDFGVNKTLTEVIKEGAFGGMQFSDIYSDVNGKWYRKLSEEFDEIKNIANRHYCSNYYDVDAINVAEQVWNMLGFWGNKTCIKFIDLYGWLQWYFRQQLGRESSDDKRQFARWNGIAIRFKGKLQSLS